jgi:hypothetical protein
MKVLSLEEARAQLDAVCQEALAGEVIRFQLPHGKAVELIPVVSVPKIPPLTALQLQECYEDEDWAAFENRCGKASD